MDSLLKNIPIDIKNMQGYEQYRALALMRLKYGLSNLEIAKIGGFKNSPEVYKLLKRYGLVPTNKSANANIKYFGLIYDDWRQRRNNPDKDISELTKLKGNSKYVNALKKYHVPYSLINNRFNDIKPYKYNSTASDHANIRRFNKLGLTLDNILWLYYYQIMHGYTIKEMIDYMKLPFDYRFALDFYTLTGHAPSLKKLRRDKISDLAIQIKRSQETLDKLKVISKGYEYLKQYRYTFKNIAENDYHCPDGFFRLALQQVVSKREYSHLTSVSGIMQAALDSGDIDHVFSEEIRQRKRQRSIATSLKKYGATSPMKNKEIIQKVVESRNKSIKTNQEIQKRLKHTGQINGAHSFRKCLDSAYQLAVNLNREYSKNLQQLINQSQDIENALTLRQKYTKQPQKLFEFLSQDCDQLITWPNTVFDDSNLLSNLQINKTMMKEYGQQRDSKIKLDDIQLNLSKDEYRLYEKIMSLPKEIRPIFITGDRQQITYYYKGQRRHYELDFYFPDLRLAIEINPSRYHSLNKYSLGDIQNIDNLAHRRDYHFDKYQRAKHDNIRLIQLFQYDLAPAKFDLTWRKIKSLLINQANASRFCTMTLNEYLHASNQTIQEFNKQTSVAVATGCNDLKYVVYSDDSLVIMTINEHSDHLEITDINANNLSSINLVLTVLVTKVFDDHQNINQILVDTDNNWNITLQQPFNLADSNLKQIYISQNVVNGTNSVFSKMLFDNAREADSEVNQDRRLKNLAAFDKNTPDDEIEQYIETELTHKGYAKEFKEENGREIQSPSDVLNTHKGYDRVFTAGSSKWVAKREDFVK